MFYDRKKYTFYSDNQVPVEILEPREWNSTPKKFVRNTIFHGVTVDLTNALTFYGDAKEYLSFMLKEFGVNVKVKLVVETRDLQTDIYAVSYTGYVDFSTYSEDENSFKVKLNSDPLVTTFKSKLNAKVELERRDDLKGNTIGVLNKETVYLSGRDILLTNKLLGTGVVNVITTGDDKETTMCLSLNEQGDQEGGIVNVHNQIPTRSFSRYDINQGYYLENMYGANDTGAPVTLKINTSIKQSLWLAGDDIGTIEFYVRFAIFSGLADPIFNREERLDEPGQSTYFIGSANDFPTHLDVQDYREITLAVNETLSIQYYMKQTGSGNATLNVHYPLSCWGGIGAPLAQPTCQYWDRRTESWQDSYYNVGITIQEDSQRDASNTPAIMIYEFAERLNEIILGAKFESNLLGRATMPQYESDGEFSQMALTNGMWVRGLKEGVLKYKPISTSLNDFFKSLNAVTPIGIDVGDNLVKIESRDYFYQKLVTVDLGEVVDLEITLDIKNHHSLITVGYEKAGGYDEDQGLDEYNRKTQYSTILDINSSELNLASKYRADGYGLETVRRDNPEVGFNVDLDKDSKFDDNIWMLDVNLPDGQTNWILSDWTKRFAKEPTGVYSPSTAINLWLSPINNILRHGGWIKAPLLKYLDSYIRFTHSEGNSALTTQLIGGNEYTQNEGIQVDDLDKAENLARIIKFKAPVTFEQLRGRSYGIKNTNGLFRFTFKGDVYKGHVLAVNELNGIGEFEMKLFS